MREIEFKAWDKQDKIMYDWEEISIEKEQVFIRDGDLYKTFEQVELIQYTGLKDKNGKKIFEGDILKDTYYRDNGWKDWKTEGKGYIRFLNAAFCLVDMEKDEEMYDTLYNRLNPSDTKAVVSVEVIGNIHENPELLEVK